ncbi:MAG: hypothetical protein WCC64_04275 [Aliidongia sp.]
MSDITPTQISTTLRLKPAISDDNAAQNRGQSTTASTASPTVSTGPAPITDSVTLSATAQALAGDQAAATPLTDEEAQTTATDLRQQISLQGLSASAKQNAAVLALIRPRR